MQCNSLLARSLVGSLLLVGACADQPDDLNVAVDEARRTPAAPRTTECTGETFADPTVSATLVVDAAAGLATLSITNHGTEEHIPEAILTVRKSGGTSTALLLPAVQKVRVAAGETGVARFSLAELGLDPSMPEQLVAEVTLRDAAGSIVERTFAHAGAGPSVADTAARLQIRAPKGTKLAAISRGGTSALVDSFRPTHDTIDEITTNPDLPLPTYNYDMCFRWPVTLVDAGFGEDYGVDPTSPWIARGGRVSIVQKGKTLFDGYLDSLGCTGAFKANGTQDFSIFGWSRAKVANNDIIARDAEGNQVSFVIWDADPGFDQHPVYVFPEVAPVTTMLAVAAFTVQKYNGGMSGKTIALENRCNPVEDGCCDCAQDAGIWLTDFGADKKFAIAHELGHRILALYTGGYNNDASFDLDPNDVLACDTSSGHAMWSMEYDAAAAMEGWAHFMAAAAFNDRAGDNPSGMFRYWSSTNTIDLEQSSPSFPSNYLDTVCTIPLGINDKMGVELDWLRHWWDYYTNALDVDPGVRPSMTQMMAEIDAAPAWTRSTVWSSIRSGVSSYSGAEQLTRWDQHGAWNGVD